MPLETMREFVLSFFHRVIRVSGIESIGASSLMLYFLLPVCLLLTEAAFTGWKKSSLKNLIENSRSSQGDLWCFVLSAVKLFDFIGLILTFGIVYAFIVFMDRKFRIYLFIPVQPMVLRVALLFLITDLKNYLRHFIFHKFRWMWELHKIHHSATRFTMLTAIRGHFVESALSRLFDAIPFIILGAFPEEFIFVNVMKETHQYLIHSQLKNNWGWIGKYILVSPAAHWLHHSVQEKHYGKNFGSAFIFWDRLFGTYATPEPIAEIGLPEDYFNEKGFFYDQLSSYRKSLRKLFQF